MTKRLKINSRKCGTCDSVLNDGEIITLKGPLQSSLMEYTDGSTLHNRQDLKIIKLHPCLLVESLTTTMHKNHIQCDGPSIVTQCTNIDNYLQTQCWTRLQRIIF